ncbi:MAG: hypothetical protein JXB47_19770, partial [Anaerolineae bacterium]|nr:hypothetical protein [Anaerolineae bacterium]
MINRRVILCVLSACVLPALLLAAPPTLGDAPAQIDPTAQQETINAAVEQRFTQTAEAMLNPTEQAMTATAAFEATVDAAFNAALTATAQAQIPATPVLPAGAVSPVEPDTEVFLEANFNFQAIYSRVLCVAAGGDCPAQIETAVPC